MVKTNSQECFDGEIADEIKNHDKLFKKFKKWKLGIDKDIYNAARYKVRKMIFSEKISLFEKKLSEFIGKPKDLRKALRSLGLPNKISSCEVSALKINNTVEHDANSILEGFKNYYSTLAENLVNMLPKAPNKYSINTVIKYYEHMIEGSHFNLASVSKNSVLTILKSTQVSKAAGLDGLSGSFLKDGANVWWLAWFWLIFKRPLPQLVMTYFCKKFMLSYLSNGSFLIKSGYNFSQPTSVSCSVPQGSILGLLVFLIYVNDMLQAV